MTALAFTAYALWVFLAAAFFRKASPRFLRKTGFRRTPFRPKGFRHTAGFRGIGASCLAAGAFFFVPPGSLPPFFNVAFGGFLFLGCLVLSALAAKDREGCIGLIPVACVAFLFFWYARMRGIPGNAANLGSFVGMPLWGIASPWETCGFLALAVGYLLSVRLPVPPDAGSAGVSYAATLRHLAVCALFVAFFLPWNTAPYLAWSNALVAGCDFILFWVKVLFLAVPLCRFVAIRAGLFFAPVLCGAGAVLVVSASLW